MSLFRTWSFCITVIVRFIFNYCDTHGSGFQCDFTVRVLSSRQHSSSQTAANYYLFIKHGINNFFVSFQKAISSGNSGRLRLNSRQCRLTVGKSYLHIPARPQILQPPPMSASARPMDSDNGRHLNRFQSV